MASDKRMCGLAGLAGGGRDARVSQVLHLSEKDGAEKEDGIEEQQTQTQPAVQPPMV